MTTTPGPWIVVMAANGHTSVYPIVDNEVGDERVADVYCPLNLEFGDIGANARLIAAAPEMLALLQVLACVGDNDGGLAATYRTECERARTLLARITP